MWTTICSAQHQYGFRYWRWYWNIPFSWWGMGKYIHIYDYYLARYPSIYNKIVVPGGYYIEWKKADAKKKSHNICLHAEFQTQGANAWKYKINEWLPEMEGKKKVERCVRITNIGGCLMTRFLNTCGMFSVLFKKDTLTVLHTHTHTHTVMTWMSVLFNLI